MKFKKVYFKITLVLICLVFSFSANAQCPNPFDPYCETGDPDLQVPLDTNIIVMLIGSAVLGAWYILKYRSKIASS